jgi:hypothetical protein
MTSKYELLRNYLTAFADKNLNMLEFMFSDDVILHDWDILATGKEAVLAANKNIFDNVNNIIINIDNFSEDRTDNNLMFAQLEVIVDDKIINVVDVIKFDKNDKITKISAYKR